ncbi:pyruvate, phosphate dikinase [Candidatus Omnitrophus magneticus]|uniref:Pyruvate, phosphate dikinase n=1 Tax=Candidatus Omnitrophus magneticus TaxID=1609969 RepID=A0A0F0CNF0_9BACT|nr:pyruvate, phosphate dikinase [Candidatus Omnitrophus magneticus]
MPEKKSSKKSTGAPKSKKMVYFFGDGKADGKSEMKDLLGGKGANLAEMAGHKNLKLPVPPGFTITTEVCTEYYKNKGKYPSVLKGQVQDALKKIEKIMDKGFGDEKDPLLVSVRSGARKSMPGMMETVLNVGLTTKTIEGIIAQTGNERFAYDSYRRLITMYSDVVMEKAQGIETEEGKGIRAQLEKIMAAKKKERGITLDTDLTSEDLKELCKAYKEKVKEVLGKQFPDDPYEQLWGGIGAVFASWNGKRAISYRKIEGIPHEWGTAVNVQSMVFGNMGEDSATGVAFTRNPGNGDKNFYGEYLINAQGEDVVAGIRTPAPINKASQSDHNKGQKMLQEAMPAIYKQLDAIEKKLEKHYRDMQDIEFTIEKGKLYLLQTRIGKRNGPAAVKMAVDMVKEKLIKPEEAIKRVRPEQLDELLHPIIDPKVEKEIKPMAKGLPAGPGGAVGLIVLDAETAVEWKKEGKKVILVREETNPEDIEGMRASEGILTARGGMTSHAALVARGWGMCCVVGCGELEIDTKARTIKVGDIALKEGDWITVNGTKGTVYAQALPMISASEENMILKSFLILCDKVRKLKIRTNADTPSDAKRARDFGAEGIGLFRMEHMFYGKGAEEPLFKLRKMIVAGTEVERQNALDELFPFVKKDIKGTLAAMEGLPVTIRLLDPPLHEFVPHQEDQLEELARSLSISRAELDKRTSGLRESNPMMGHRGVRLGITYPEITRMSAKAILEASAELLKEGKKVFPEIMIPVVVTEKEVSQQKAIIEEVCAEVTAKYGIKKMPLMIGTMIETPRAALMSDKIALVAEFFSFGTNDLTQMGFGFSRDDIGAFLPEYIEKKILPDDPFQTIDKAGIGQLIKISIELGRKARKGLKIGICGEHGGEAKSISFCYESGMDYVSCSPFRVPIARLAAAQAVLK